MFIPLVKLYNNQHFPWFSLEGILRSLESLLHKSENRNVCNCHLIYLKNFLDRLGMTVILVTQRSDKLFIMTVLHNVANVSLFRFRDILRQKIMWYYRMYQSDFNIVEETTYMCKDYQHNYKQIYEYILCTNVNDSCTTIMYQELKVNVCSTSENIRSNKNSIK